MTKSKSQVKFTVWKTFTSRQFSLRLSQLLQLLRLSQLSQRSSKSRLSRLSLQPRRFLLLLLSLLLFFSLSLLLSLSMLSVQPIYAEEKTADAETISVLQTADAPDKLTPAVYAKRYQREALRLLNEYRRAHGVKALSFSKKLQKAADLRAKEALENPDLSHKRFNKKGKLHSFSSVYDDLNLHIRYRGTGENLAWRAYQTSPEAAAKGMFQQWKKSPAHRKNMLDSRYDTAAIAIAYDETGSKEYDYGAASAQLFISSRKAAKQSKP